MKAETLSEAIGMLDDDIIIAADKAREVSVRRSRTPIWIGLGSMAACAAIIVSIALKTSDSDGLPVAELPTAEAAATEEHSEGCSTDADYEDIPVDDPIYIETDDSWECTDGSAECDDVIEDETADAVVETVEAIEPSDTNEVVDDVPAVTEEVDDVVDDTDENDEVIEPDTQEVVEEEGTGEVADESEEMTEFEETLEIIETGEVNETEEEAPPEEPRCYDDIFEEILDNPATGPAMSYDEVMEMVSSPRGGGLDSYYLFEVERVLTIGECEELDGFAEAIRSYYPGYSEETTEVGAVDADWYPKDFIIYEVTVHEDLIAGPDEEICDRMYIMSTGNSLAYQRRGDPPYAEGELFTAALMLPIEGTDIRRTTGSFALRYDIMGSIAFSRDNYPLDQLGLPDSVVLEGGLPMVTSTTGNPAIYTQSIKLESLVSFLREDWKRRGISRHFSTE